MDKEVPFNEYKRYKNYQMFCTYMINEISEKPYVRMKIYYKDKEIYCKDLYDEERFTSEDIYGRECLAHQRERRLNQLGIKN